MAALAEHSGGGRFASNGTSLLPLDRLDRNLDFPPSAMSGGSGSRLSRDGIERPHLAIADIMVNPILAGHCCRRSHRRLVDGADGIRSSAFANSLHRQLDFGRGCGRVAG